MDYKKNYIGKGKNEGNFGIVKITLKMEEVLKYVYTKDGNDYITFELSKLQKEDEYGRSHTCYVQTRVQENAAKDQDTANEAPANVYPAAIAQKIKSGKLRKSTKTTI